MKASHILSTPKKKEQHIGKRKMTVDKACLPYSYTSMYVFPEFTEKWST